MNIKNEKNTSKSKKKDAFGEKRPNNWSTSKVIKLIYDVLKILSQAAKLVSSLHTLM